MLVCSKTPLLYLLTQKTAQKFGYVLGIGGQKPQEREDVTALSAVFAPPVPPQREGPYPIPKP